MKKIFLTFLILCVAVSGCGSKDDAKKSDAMLPSSAGAQENFENTAQKEKEITLGEIPEYSGSAYVAVNDNIPFFDDSELVTEAFEQYSPLDSLGRCQAAYANIGKEIMPTEERGSIGSVKPAGWHLAKYDAVDGKYLYNRCHLIAYQLAGENANECNLITGTRYLNISGMAPFEDMVADYVKETGNHVLYRVTPMFEGDHLLADGVRMEAKSVEDDGEGVMFHVFCYNVQPGIEIDYASGDSRLIDGSGAFTDSSATLPFGQETVTYILNTSSKKFHVAKCASVKKIAGQNRQEVAWSRDECIAGGYEPCKNCKP